MIFSISCMDNSKEEVTLHSIDVNSEEEVTLHSNDADSEEEFTLYSMDANSEEEVILGTIAINKNITLKEKLEKLSEALSEEAFSSLPLNLMEIKNVDGKERAVFNFEEEGTNQNTDNFTEYIGKIWYGCFQGSTGGRITEYTLEETLLQRDYTDKWIDGIQFTYKNKTVAFDHVPGLSNIIYR